jgi:hypothetical protein
VPMVTKLERREIQKSIGRSVKKFMKERIGRKAKGGLSLRNKKKREEDSYFKFREEIEKRQKRKQWKRDMQEDLERYEKEKKGVWVRKGGLLIKPRLAKRGF